MKGNPNGPNSGLIPTVILVSSAAAVNSYCYSQVEKKRKKKKSPIIQLTRFLVINYVQEQPPFPPLLHPLSSSLALFFFSPKIEYVDR